MEKKSGLKISPGCPTDARAYQYAGALYVYATGGYFEGGTGEN
jgi:hypothetical protein